MSVKMKSMYARAIHEFIDKVNKLDNVKLSWANAYDGKQNNIRYVDDESKFNKSAAKGADKLLLVFTSSVGQGTRTAYGFRNDPDLGSSGSASTSLAYSSRSSRGNDINGIAATYNKSIASRDEMLMIENMPADVFKNLSRYTSRVYNSVPTYAVLFDGYSYADYDETIENIKALTTAPEYAEHLEGVRDNMSTIIEAGVLLVDEEEGEELQAEHYLTCDNMAKYAFMDMLAATYVDEDDIPREYVDKTLGLDCLYEVLSEINDDLNKQDTTVDLAARLSGDNDDENVLSQECSNAIMALNTVALYGVIRRKNNLLLQDDTGKTQDFPQIVVSDDFYNTLKYVNSNRIGRSGAKDEAFDEITDAIGTPIHSYNKCCYKGEIDYDAYVNSRSLTVASKYRIYQAIVNPETKNGPSNIPYAEICFDEDSSEYSIYHNGETYTLKDFVDGKGDCVALRKALPCLATCSYDVLLTSVDDVYKKFSKNNPEETSCDILAVEMGIFKNMSTKDSDIARVLQNSIDDFDTRYRDHLMQQGTLFLPMIHNTNIPSYDNGTYEIGTFIENTLAKRQMIDFSVEYDDDMLETCVKSTQNLDGSHAHMAHSFRETDLMLRKLQLINEQFDNSIFHEADYYMQTVDSYMSEASNTGKYKANDFMTLVDAYNAFSLKSLKSVVDDINRVYEDTPQICPSNSTYRPKNANEATILRNMCAEFDVLDKAPAAVMGRNRDFVDVVETLAKTIKGNVQTYDFSKSINTASGVARMYDTLDDTTYSNVVDILTRIDARESASPLQKTDEKSAEKSAPTIPTFKF